MIDGMLSVFSLTPVLMKKSKIELSNFTSNFKPKRNKKNQPMRNSRESG